MAQILKPVRLVNPGKVKRRLTAKQKLFFGSKRQRAAVKRSMQGKRHNPSFGSGKYSTNRKERKSRSLAQKAYHQRKHFSRVNKRKTRSLTKRLYSGRLPNVGEIITIRPLINSGTKSSKKRRTLPNMAKSAKRRAAGLKAARTRKRNKAARSSAHRRRVPKNPGHRRRTYARRAPKTRTRTIVKYRTRTGNPGHRRRKYPRNPGIMSGNSSIMKIAGVIGGAMITKIASGFLPSGLNTGIPSYIGIGLIAMLQGKAVGKLLKNPSLGNDMALGGYVYLALKIANDYFPSLGLSLSGLGLIGGSSFYTPQVNQPGSMGTFILPAAVAGAIPPMATSKSMSGLGAGTSMRRVGRLR